MRCFVWVLGAALAAPCGAWAQAVPTTSLTPIDSAAGRPPAGQRSTLLKLGTGLTRGFAWSGYGWLSLPVVVGAERALAPGWSVYANGFTGVQVFPLARRSWPSYRSSLLVDPGFDAGIRWYYNQAKRQAKGKRTGPLIGNYLALHTITQFWSSFARPTDYGYDYSAALLMWGLQRRLGGHGLLDAYVGAGVNNPGIYYYDYQTGMGSRRRKVGLELELGVRLSLVP